MVGIDADIAAILGEPLPEPPSELVKAEIVAAWLGISVQKAHELGRGGILPRKRAGRGNVYQLQECTLAYIDHVQHSPKTEDSRLKRERRIGLELKNAETRGELVAADEVERRWSAILTDVRSFMLAIPSRVGERLAHLTPHDIETMDREIRLALAEASGDADD